MRWLRKEDKGSVVVWCGVVWEGEIDEDIQYMRIIVLVALL